MTSVTATAGPVALEAPPRAARRVRPATPAAASPLRPRRHLAQWPRRGVCALTAIALHLAAGWAWLRATPAPVTPAQVPPMQVDLLPAPLPLAAPEPPKPLPAKAAPAPATVARPAAKPTPQPVARQASEPSPLAPSAEPARDAAPEPAPAAAATPSNNAAASTAHQHAGESAPAEPLIAPRFDAAYLSNPAPPYPGTARRMGEQGTVMLRVHVTVEGTASRVELKRSSGSPRLDQSALETVRNWKFIPAKRGDRKVAEWVVVPIKFSLEDAT